MYKNNHSFRLTGQINSKISTFKSVEKMVDIFLTNVDKLATTDDIEKYILDNFNIQVIEVNKLDIKTNVYNCFKIKINLNDREKLFDASLWPSGIIVNKFYSRRN